MAVELVSWLTLITNLPGRNATVRMRLWRRMKEAGAGLLRDGVYVLPDSKAARALFGEQAAELLEAGGSSYVMSLASESVQQEGAVRALFDRTEDYVGLQQRLADLRRGLAKLSEIDARRQLTVLRREALAVMARDFFPGKSKDQIEAELEDAEVALNAQFSPDEPHPAGAQIQRRDLKDYQGRVWATRKRLWVDRVACAWLIRRFIDPQARFVWLKTPADCPKKALGFDFDGALFTHAGNKVSFEVLLTSFGLDQDIGLARLGALVHQLDVGGIPVAEAAGFVAILTGARELQPDDDALLNAMTAVLDSLYASYAAGGR